jgi:hypothetical protein
VKTRAWLSGFPFLVVLLVAGGASRPAWADGPPIDTRWLPWLGCWELQSERYDAEEQPPADVLVCLSSKADVDGIQITTLADMESVMTEALVADGVRRPVDEHGCSGWRAAEWSRDGRRLFLDSELVCDRQVERSLSGAAFVDASGAWVDVQIVSSGPRRELLVRRYWRVSEEETEAAGFADPAASRPESRWARASLGAPLRVPDVVEAASHVRPEVLEAMLVEAGTGFELRGATLLELAEARVPTPIIDLMVALSFPDSFRVDRLGEPERVPPPGASLGGGQYASWYPFYMTPLLYGSYGYDYCCDYRVLPPSSDAPPATHGRVVQGQGYTRVSPQPHSGSFWGGSGGKGGSSSDSGGSGTASSGGYSHGDGGSTGRTAHVRD